MQTTFILLYFVVGTLFFLLCDRAFRRARFREYLERPCTGFRWWDCFPNGDKEAFRAFLRTILSTLRIQSKNCCVLRPDDRVVDVYGSLRSSFWTLSNGDEMDFLDIELKESYGVKLEEVWQDDLTLGQLFAICHRAG